MTNFFCRTDGASYILHQPSSATHPRGDALAGALLEGEAEGAVAAVAAFAGQLLGYDGHSGSDDLLVATDEVVDAQVIDIGVVGDALTGEELAEVEAVGANGLGQLLQREVVLQVKLRGDAVLCQLSLDLGEVDIDGLSCWRLL